MDGKQWQESKSAISDVINRYCVEADRGRMPELFALFAEDTHYQFGDRTYDGQQGLRELFSESGRRVKESGKNFGRVLHSVTTSVIDVTDADHATAVTYVAVLTNVGVDHFGEYRDEFVSVDGNWKIAKRRFVLGWAAPDGLGDLLR